MTAKQRRQFVFICPSKPCDPTAFLLNARYMEDEAWSYACSSYGLRGPEAQRPPVMTEVEIIDQYRRFQAVSWLRDRNGDWHKVGLSWRARLAFSHHSMKQLRRQLAFAELGGTPCPCATVLELFGSGVVWVGLPLHFRRAVAALLARRFERQRQRVRFAAGVTEPSSLAATKAVYRPTVFRYRRYTRISGRRTQYGQED